MDLKKGICTNWGGCAKADDEVVQEVPLGADFICTQCGMPLKEVDDGNGDRRFSKRWYAVLAGLAVIAIGAILWWPPKHAGEDATSELVVNEGEAIDTTSEEAERGSLFQQAFNRISNNLSRMADAELSRSDYENLRMETLDLFSTEEAHVVLVGEASGETTERRTIRDFLSQQRLVQQHRVEVQNVELDGSGKITQVMITRTKHD